VATSSLEHERRAVREQVQARPRRVDHQAALRQTHVAPDRVAQHREHVGAGRRAEPGRELLGVACSAHERAPLEHERTQARPGEVERRDEAVVATADDDRLSRLGHDCRQ
jgi:hypothetical protein